MNGDELQWDRPEPGELAPAASELLLRGGPGQPLLQPLHASAGISYWQLAWGHKLVLCGFLLVGLIAGVAVAILKTPRYRASTTVELVGFNQSFMNMSQVDPQAGTDTTSASASNIQTQMRILTSRSMLDRVQERLSLEMTPVTSTPGNLFGKLRTRIPFKQKDPLEQAREAVAEAVSTVSPHGVGATRLIEIQCESTSPDVAANFLNTLAAEHISQNLAARSSVTQRTSQWMESQLEEARSRLQDAGEKLREFVQKSGMDFFPEVSTLADSKLRQLQVDVSAIQADRIAKQARWELAKNTPPENLGDVLNDATLQGIKSKLLDLRRERAQLMATLTAEHYKVQRIQAQVTDQEQAYEKEKTSILNRLSNDYQEALRREKLLATAYSSQTHAVGAQLDKSSQYTMLKREVDMAQQVYTTLLQQSNQAALVALVPTSNIRVVDPAVPVPIPSSPRPRRDVPFSGFASMALGYGFLWLREMLRRKKEMQMFSTPGTSRRILGVPELGVIPSVLASSPNGLARFRGAALDFAADSPSRQLEFATWRDRTSLLAESFRQTITSILRTKPARPNPVYIVTSAGPGEGKTTLAANVAIAMAGIGRRVLLVDADLRRARLHLLFGLRDRPGLSDLLIRSSAPAVEDMAAFVNPTEVPNLYVMTNGLAETETPAGLFFSPRLGEVVAALQKEFDFILVDTSPVMLFPDARLWGKHSDGVVLIVRSGITTQENAARVCERFLEDGVQVLGTILNDWAPRDKSPHGYHYYSYQSRYGQKE